MKATVLLGNEVDDNSLDTVRKVLGDALEAKGIQANFITLNEHEIDHCVGCFGCWITTPGECVIKDYGQEVAKQVIQSDITIFLTPLSFGGYSSTMKKAVDRLIPLISPFFTKVRGEVHHEPRYDKYPHMIGLGVDDRKDPDAEKIFKMLIQRNAINFHSPGFSAKVFASDDKDEVLRKKIAKALKDAGVGK
jgi:multimeric flavodoxin WrbA